MVHVTNLTPGSDNPTRAVLAERALGLKAAPVELEHSLKNLVGVEVVLGVALLRPRAKDALLQVPRDLRRFGPLNLGQKKPPRVKARRAPPSPDQATLSNHRYYKTTSNLPFG